MVERTRKNIPDEINKLKENETTVVSTYSSKPPSNQNTRSNNKIKLDDLIRSLSDAYENKRARQVFEWETIQRKSFQKAA